MEPLERLHQRVQGAGANSPVQGDGEAGGLSAVSPAFVIPNSNVDVRFRLTPSLPSLGLRGRRWNRASDSNRQTPVNDTQEKFHETPSE